MRSPISVHEIQCQSGLHKLKRKYPYGWDLNIYRGCQHGCIYCYAQNSPGGQPGGRFNKDISVKMNIAEVLENELSSPNWKRDIINIGGVTDSYQPVEAHYQLMPRILELCIRTRTPVIVSTKSDLILRDKELIAALAEITYVNVAVTVTVMDEDLRKIIEPGAPSAQARFNVLEEFADTRVSRGLHLMPIIPYITDDERNLSKILSAAAQSKCHYALCGTLYLQGKTRQAFFQTLEENMPDVNQKLRELYITGAAPKTYKEELYQRVNHWRNRLGITGNYSQMIKERLPRL